MSNVSFRNSLRWLICIIKPNYLKKENLPRYAVLDSWQSANRRNTLTIEVELFRFRIVLNVTLFVQYFLFVIKDRLLSLRPFLFLWRFNRAYFPFLLINSKQVNENLFYMAKFYLKKQRKQKKKHDKLIEHSTTKLICLKFESSIATNYLSLHNDIDKYLSSSF